jgi:cytochrome c oxidase subunit 2
MGPLLRLVVPFVAGAATLAGCGGDGSGASGTDSADGGGNGGKTVFTSKGCSSCHGTGIAPDLEGIYGTDVELEDGTTVTVDDAYIERSITDPGAQRVAGYDVKMPSVDLSDGELAALVAYVRELGGGDEPGATVP